MNKEQRKVGDQIKKVAIEVDPKKDAKLLKRISDDPVWALTQIRGMLRDIERYTKKIKEYEKKEMFELEKRYQKRRQV